MILQVGILSCCNHEIYRDIPSGKRLHNYRKSPFYSWENSLFQWQFLIANRKRLPGISVVIHG